MPMNTATLPKKGLKKHDYNIDMDMKDYIATLPKKGLKKYDYNIDMEKKDLEKLTKDQLIELLLKQEKKKPKVVIVDDTKPTRLNRPPPIQEVVQRIKPTPPPRTGKWANVKPKPVPRKRVKEYEDYILPLNMKRYPKPTRKAPQIPTKVEDQIILPPERFRNRPKKPTRAPPKPPVEQIMSVKEMVKNYEERFRNRPKKPTRKAPPPPVAPKPSRKLQPIPKPRTDERQPLQLRRYPKPTRKAPSLPEQFRDYIIQPPEQFRDGYKPPKPTRRPPPPPEQIRNYIIQPPKQFRDKPPKPTRRPPPPPIATPKIKELNKAIKGYAKSYGIELLDNSNPLNHFTKTKELVESYLENLLKNMKGFKFVETLEMTFEKDSIDSKAGKRISTYKTAFFNGKAKTIINENDIKHELDMSRQEILNLIDKWVSEGSGWVIDRLDRHYINVTKYKPLHGSSYIELPKELKNPKKGLININNEDDECFRWCHIRHLNPQEKDPERIKKKDKKMINELNYEGVDFPISQKHYNKIEKQNNIRINVFGYEDKQPYPIHISKEKFEDQMNLLLITEDEKKHYVLIKDFNKFMYRQSKHKSRKNFCMYCLQCFSSEEILKNHTKNCLTINGMQAINMPKPGKNILSFKNFYKQLPVPFVIYADFEAITKKVQCCEPIENKENKSYTEAYQNHEDCGFSYKLVCCYDDQYSKDIKIYRGENAVYTFMNELLGEVNFCKNIVRTKFNKPLIMTKDDQRRFKLMDKCYICGVKYNKNDKRVRDHCHMTGKFRGSAHRDCNLQLRISPDDIKIPVIFHNLKGYDSHFIMQQIGKIAKRHRDEDTEQNLSINVIPNNMEKYMAFMLGNNLTFIDSFQFMSSSLDKLVNNLPKEDLKYTSKVFKGKRLDLMSKKGVYPYDYMDSFEKFDQEELPKKEDFYSILNDQNISDKEYDHAKNVWKKFKLKNMGQYHDLYLVSDVLLLADVFESFRKTCLEYYKLDPCHYFTSPGLSWDAMLKMTEIKLELMTDIDMYQFIEKGLRGGISYIANRYGQANNKYMKKYDENKPSKYIMYLDANNLYGWAMSQALPTGNFKWLTENEIDNLDLEKFKKDGDEGLILEVDLKYPNKLHHLHNDYPLGPEKIMVSSDMLSEYCKKNCQ